ncbi:MAG: NAD(+)/NADH kinase [Polyangiaceae bacterium]|jgi:NAD+ kinase
MSPPPRVSVVVKRSMWSRWVDEEHDERVTTLLDAKDETVRRVRQAHIDHCETVEEVGRALGDVGAQAEWTTHPHKFQVASGSDLVITIGGDGTLLAASHGIGRDVPLLGVNSAPASSVGFFCAAKKGTVRDSIEAALRGSLRPTELTRMRVDLNGRLLHTRVLNEALFCHESPAATSRYILRIVGPRNVVVAEDEQKSSGIWVGPAAGSTAAQRSAGGSVLPLSSRQIQYVVREPYEPHREVFHMAVGTVEIGQCVALRSKMRHARLFLDGDHIMHEVSIGDSVTLSAADEPLLVLGLARGDRSQDGQRGQTGAVA